MSRQAYLVKINGEPERTIYTNRRQVDYMAEVKVQGEQRKTGRKWIQTDNNHWTDGESTISITECTIL